MDKKWKITLLAAVIIINCIIAYYPHFSNPYPILTDEYNHISFGKYILDEHRLPFTNPYFQYGEKHINFESGFHFFLALMFAITPGEPILYYKYFIVIFMIINSSLLFYLTFLWFKNYYISLLSVLFYGTIKSTGDLLAHNYFLPLTLGISLLLLSFIFFHKWEKEDTNSLLNKYIVYLMVILAITAITYPPALTFFAGILSLYILSMNHNLNKKLKVTKKQFLIYFICIFLISAILIISILSYYNSANYIIFNDTWTPIQADYSPIFFFGIISSVFAFLGLFHIMRKNKEKIIFYWFIFSIINIYLFYIFKFSILVPFIRLFVFYLIGMSILSGIGIIFTYNIIANYLNNYGKPDNIKYIKLLVVSIILLLILINYFFVFKYDLNPPHIINKDKYEALKYFKENYPKDLIIIANSYESHSIYPITGNKVHGIIGGNIGGGLPYVSNKLIYASCEEKKQIINKAKIDYPVEIARNSKKYIMISDFHQNCDVLQPIYEKGYFIYKIII